MIFRKNHIAKSLVAIKNIPDDETGDRFIGQVMGKHAAGVNICTIWWQGRNRPMEHSFEIDTGFDRGFRAGVIVKEGIVYLYRYEWIHYFKKIFLINLPERTDKLKTASEELSRYNIPFEVFPAIKHHDGRRGIFMTMQSLFSKYAEDYSPILCFEDDILFVRDPEPVMERCVEQLQHINWDLFYMGPNTHDKFPGLYRPNLLPLRDAFARHATAYSYAGMRKILALNWSDHSLDIMIRSHIQPQGNCYCSWPFLATQRNGFSDIDNKQVTYDYIHERFITHTKDLPPYGDS